MTRAWVLTLALLAGVAVAHPDLDLQIEALSDEILARPESVDLYLRRADLYRRHGDWAAARADFETVRSIDPNAPELNWFEGHALVDEGLVREGEARLSRFLAGNPDHVAALEVRARARSLLGWHREAAQDFAHVIAVSEHPAPVLFTNLAVQWLALEPADDEAARAVLDQATSRFPQEVSLLGLAFDLALVSGRDAEARQWMDRSSLSLQALPRWAWRLRLLECVEGQPGGAIAARQALSQQPSDRARAGTWSPPATPPWPGDTKAGPDWCREAARAGLHTEIQQRLAFPASP